MDKHDPQTCLRCKLLTVITDHYASVIEPTDATELLAILASICGEALGGANTQIVTSFFNTIIYHQQNMQNLGRPQ